MRVLLDTNAVSELPKDVSPVIALLERVPQEDVFIGVPTIGEIQKGASLLPIGRRRRLFESWLVELKVIYADRLLTFGLESAIIWGELAARTIKAGHNIGVVDLQIAAIALQHELAVVTRNVRDFIPTGVPVINPWET